jgi:hypothetical protein
LTYQTKKGPLQMQNLTGGGVFATGLMSMVFRKTKCNAS